MKLSNNSDFFKKKGSAAVNTAPKSAPAPEKKSAPRVNVVVRKEFSNNIKQICEKLVSMGLKNTASKIAEAYKQACNDRFCVAVVGEFSKGKSTFINKLLNKDFLPVADLPSTAMMTRIRYNQNEVMAVLDENGNKKSMVPLSQASWDGLTADNEDGNDAKGVVYVGVNDPWLASGNIEIIDTPGAGDLEAHRVQVIGDALQGCDGAIIAISATAALSMSEKLFIEQRLISRKTPFLMIALTKLDQIPVAERSMLVKYVKDRLALWNMDIPVFLPYTIDMPDDKYTSIMGMDKIKKQINAWICDPKRVKLTEEWICGRIADVIESQIGVLSESLVLSEADKAKRAMLIDEKMKMLDDAKATWADIKSRFEDKGKDCYRMFCEKVDDSKQTITERLQYEASHSNSPQKWWSDDYPYRLKIELSNMSAAIENTVTRKLSDDVRWLNSNLEHSFKTHVLYESERITDKESVAAADVKSVAFEDIGRQRNAMRVGTTVASIALYAVCASVGVIPLIATMGIGTGASILSEKVFSGKIEKQRQTMKEAIAVNVPNAITSSTEQSEKRIRNIYREVLASAAEKEKEWLNSQKAIIENSVNGADEAKKKKIYDAIDALKALKIHMENI